MKINNEFIMKYFLLMAVYVCSLSCAAQTNPEKVVHTIGHVDSLEKAEKELEERRWDTIAYKLAEKYVKDNPQEFLHKDEEDQSAYALAKAIDAQKQKTLLEIRNDLARVTVGGDKFATFYLPTVSGYDNKKDFIINELTKAYERLQEEKRIEQEAQAELLQYTYKNNGVRSNDQKNVYALHIKSKAFVCTLYIKVHGFVPIQANSVRV